MDRHHSDLYHSLQVLFEDRLGMIAYTPVGHDWWDAGYWRFGHGYGDDRLAQQFLALDGWEPYPGDDQGGLWVTRDKHHPDRQIIGIELHRALATREWTHVVCTVDDNQAGFRRFADEATERRREAPGTYPDPVVKYVLQIGNARQGIDRSLEPIILDIAQEFDHTGVFGFRQPVRQNRITSFANLLPLIPEMWEGFTGLRDRLPDYGFRSYGHACPDGFMDPVDMVAGEMVEAGWAYHDKVTGDGFGHVIHNWAAIGRPLIGHARYYEGQRAEVLWRDGVTCIDLDRHSLDEAAEIIRATTPERHAEMCRAIRAVLDATYDPAADAETARALLL